MRIFRRDGYDKTTMRAVAKEAGVSLGNAYYYFASKEHLVQAFYFETQAQHEAACEEVLRTRQGFADRFVGVMEAWLDVAEPSHAFATQFFKNAADPDSPLSPFSPESAPARSAAVGIWARMVDGADVKVSAELRAELPELLWLMQMGVVLFWVYDRSPGQERSRALVRRAAPLVERLLKLSRVPLVRGTTDDLVALVRFLRTPS